MSKTEEVAKLRLAGVSHMDIAKAADISISAVAREVKKARAADLLPPKPPSSSAAKLTEEVKRNRVVRGTVREVLETLSPEARQWLLATTPDGSSVASMLAAIVTDAYHEEMDG